MCSAITDCSAFQFLVVKCLLLFFDKRGNLLSIAHDIILLFGLRVVLGTPFILSLDNPDSIVFKPLNNIINRFFNAAYLAHFRENSFVEAKLK